jgi:alkylhydroperoxidase/carboxymuconolactone decarboxylase family protein YurZ
MPAEDAVTAAEILARVRAERGAAGSWQEVLARHDPAALERHHENFMAVMAMPALSRKVKHLIIAAIDIQKAWPGARVHIREAIEAGATEEEIVEAIVTAAVPGGPSTLAFGISALQEVEAELGGGPESWPLAETTNSQEAEDDG